MYQALLVPLDGSPFSEQALPAACDIARRAGAIVHLVHIHAPYRPIYVEGLPVIDESLHSLRREHERTYLERRREQLAVESGLRIISALCDGPIAETIAEYARATKTNLIVMMTHGYGGFERAWLGSVADALVRCSPVPVLLLRPGEGATDLERPPALQKILIPLDASSPSEQILEQALALGTLMQAEYTLLHVVEPIALGGMAPVVFAPGVDPGALEQSQRAAQRYLDDVAVRLRAEGAQVQTRILVSPQPAAAILDAARQDGIELIAMATHGRGGLARLLLGSVADKVLRGAEIPVLLYRPREEHSTDHG